MLNVFILIFLIVDFIVNCAIGTVVFQALIKVKKQKALLKKR